MFHRRGGMHLRPSAQQNRVLGLPVEVRASNSSYFEVENSIATLGDD